MLIGDWVGVGIIFYPNGAYHSHIASRVCLHDEIRGNQRFLRYQNFSGEGDPLPHPSDPAPPGDVHDLFTGVVASICRCNYEMLFAVNGKRTVAVEKSPSILSAVGYMSTNDNYSFIVRDTYNLPNGETEILTLHNNHYFPSSNTRQVFGTIEDSQGQTVLLTSFIYTSYTPPPGQDD
ncbi:hypothetical protein [Paraliomyxa miuraensis]|uniref:hypothetical protein n=1 Tax=Paraliomyxa miuraensis TaxID=376150 RepID=UPI00225996E9|nr:hypothetical protein [Paraliomyxa miuraensis]MCX4247016.1 hypothetical protein [Paraliomyxa miuraensis]